MPVRRKAASGPLSGGAQMQFSVPFCRTNPVCPTDCFSKSYLKIRLTLIPDELFRCYYASCSEK